jgi:hypothetical protein
MDVLASLPDNIRAEMMHRYGISENITVKGEVIEVSDDDEPCVVSGRSHSGRPREVSAKPTKRPDHSSDRDHEQVEPHVSTASRPRITAAEDAIPIKEDTLNVDGVGAAEDVTGTPSSTNQDSDVDNDSEGACEKCGSYVFGFAALAHARWHEQMDPDATEAGVV